MRRNALRLLRRMGVAALRHAAACFAKPPYDNCSRRRAVSRQRRKPPAPAKRTRPMVEVLWTVNSGRSGGNHCTPFGGLRAHGFSDAEIFDIVATSAGRVFFTKLRDGLGVLGDAAFGGMDAALVEGLMVGRPLDSVAPERLETAA